MGWWWGVEHVCMHVDPCGHGEGVHPRWWGRSNGLSVCVCHIPFILLGISSPLAQLCTHKTQTECSHSERYSGSLDLHYVSPFLSPFWFVYIHTSSHFVHSSNSVPGCVHCFSLRVILWTFSNLHCSVMNSMYSLLVYNLIVQLLYSLASLSM